MEAGAFTAGSSDCHQHKVVSQSLQYFLVITNTNTPFSFVYQIIRVWQGAIWGQCSGQTERQMVVTKSGVSRVAASV